MKKTYMQPATEIVKILTDRFVATSIDINSNGDAVDAGGAAARGYNSDWDEDED